MKEKNRGKVEMAAQGQDIAWFSPDDILHGSLLFLHAMKFIYHVRLTLSLASLDGEGLLGGLDREFLGSEEGFNARHLE